MLRWAGSHIGVAVQPGRPVPDVVDAGERAARLAALRRPRPAHGRLSGQGAQPGLPRRRQDAGHLRRHGVVVWPFAGADGPMGKQAMEIGFDETVAGDPRRRRAGGRAGWPPASTTAASGSATSPAAGAPRSRPRPARRSPPWRWPAAASPGATKRAARGWRISLSKRWPSAPAAGMATVPAMPKDTSAADARTLFEAAGWRQVGAGDWSWVFADPSDELAARVTPFDPGYRMFAEACLAGTPKSLAASDDRGAPAELRRLCRPDAASVACQAGGGLGLLRGARDRQRHRIRLPDRGARRRRRRTGAERAARPHPETCSPRVRLGIAGGPSATSARVM